MYVLPSFLIATGGSGQKTPLHLCGGHWNGCAGHQKALATQVEVVNQLLDDEEDEKPRAPYITHWTFVGLD